MIAINNLQEMEVFFNFKHLCAAMLDMDLERALHIFNQQASLAFPQTEQPRQESMQVFLTSMNRSLYNYILYKRDISLHSCCCQNSPLVHSCSGRDDLMHIGEHILKTYLHELAQTQDVNIHIARAKQFIEENLSEPLSLEQVAGQVFVCKAYLSELFSSCTGVKFSEYVTMQRVEHAKKLLTQSRESIQTISQDCGFSSPTYFSSVFTRVTGKSPRKYRQEVCQNIA